MPTLTKRHLALIALLLCLALILACANAARLPASAPSTPAAAGSTCGAPIQVGFRVTQYGGVKAALWYPSATAEAPYAYSPDISSSLARDGLPLQGCGTFPLVIFSHGLAGCGTQSIFLTETLARSGYIVAAPDHQDALLCSVDGTPQTFAAATEPPILKPQTWNASSYIGRRDDIEKVLDGILQDAQLKMLIDPDALGIAGHSLGGYTALAMVGGWPSWNDPRFKAALLLSPYSLPFSINNTLPQVHVPLMYQGAQGDVGITPFLEGKQGAYAQSNPPKYFMKLAGGNHFTWTNAVCADTATIAGCLQSKPQAKLITDYAIAFFNSALKGEPETLLTTPDSALAGFQFQP